MSAIDIWGTALGLFLLIVWLWWVLDGDDDGRPA